MVPWSLPSSLNNNTPSSKKKVLAGKVSAQPPIATINSMFLNGPESPPVLFDPYAAYNNNSSKSIYNNFHDDDEERCRSCHSKAIVTDWPQGDRVCTNCGVVAEGRIRDDRPEWRDFNDAEDIIKGGQAKARSGLVSIDETKYLGGLQPTILSKDAFGANCGGYKMTKIRRQLKATNKRLDHLMEKVHKRTLEEAKLERRVRLKRLAESKADGKNVTMRAGDYGSQSEVRHEFDMIVLQEEENTNRLHAAIYAEKWSLDRAVFLHGTSEDTRSTNNLEIGESRDEMLSQMDRTLQDASRDLYTAYTMINQAARTLRLPNRVVDEVINRFVRYVTRRDGFTVKGVSSRLPSGKGKESKEERKIAAARLRVYNKMKQISSLGAAIIFLTARTLGFTRTIVEICDCFQPFLEESNGKIQIKPKHCSYAMNEIKSFFPEYTRDSTGKDSHSISSDSYSISNFADHFVRNLQLPPVAEACIRTLLAHCKHEQVELGINSGIKMPSLCGAVTYFVCSIGAAMQKVATQVQLKVDNTAIDIESSKSNSQHVEDHVKGNDDDPTYTKPVQNSTKDAENDSEPFDVFSHAAIAEDQPEKLEYDMRRMWDAWAEQMKWSRSLLQIEQSCGVSSNIVLNLYKSSMYPRRDLLLNILKDAVTTEQVSEIHSSNGNNLSLRQTPLASILLAQISTAGALMSRK